jgi:putative glycosyltransferase (TIGR04348 family)
MLRDRFRIIVQTAWDGKPADAMIALHARRSADSIERFHASGRGRSLAVVLTGTDLYGDLHASAEVAASLDRAGRIVVLQEDAQRLLGPRWRRKSEVIYQSATPIARRAKPRGRLDCVMVGHLRAVKDPLTALRALEQLPRDLQIRLVHIGAPLDPALAQAAHELAARDTRYRYAGALPHGRTRAAIARAHVLLVPSLAEGGANVIAEAVASGTAVIASAVSGNIGMLGRDYAGYFEAGNASELAGRLVRALEDPRYLRLLQAGCARRRKLFTPSSESRAVRRLVGSLLA